MRQKIDKNETENDQNGAQKVSQTDKKWQKKRLWRPKNGEKKWIFRNPP
jgi:hypothetical protein